MPDSIRTASRIARNVAGPTIDFSIAEEITALKQEPEWLAGTRNSVTVVKTANLSIVLTAVRRGVSLCGHAVDGPITLQVLSGSIRFGVADEPKVLEAGTMIALEKEVSHDILALEDSDLLLTIVKDVNLIRPQPVEGSERHVTQTTDT